MNNLYIDQGIEQDAQNDMNIILELRTKVGDAIHHAQKLESAGAMAYNGDLLVNVIDKLAYKPAPNAEAAAEYKYKIEFEMSLLKLRRVTIDRA